MESAFDSRTMKSLEKIGIENPWELILNLPQVYDDFTQPAKSISKLRQLPHGSHFYAALILDEVKSSDELVAEKKATGATVTAPRAAYARVSLTDGARTVSSMIYGHDAGTWLRLRKDSLGKVFMVSGTIAHRDGFLNLNGLQTVPLNNQGKIVARYRGKEKVIRPDRVADLTKIALIHHLDEAVHEITSALGESEAEIISTCHLPFDSIKSLLYSIHLPESSEAIIKTMAAAKDLNSYHGVKKALDGTERKPVPEAAIELDIPLIKKLVEQHPFTPTGDQKRAIWDIIQDMAKETPMERLLSADVGNGKTLAYGIPAAYAAHKGKNVVVLLPTEPLAGQVAENIQEWYPELNIHLVTAGFNKEVGPGSILIGTTAVLSWLKKNPDWKVDFAITDEQQKMGTAQRDALNNEGTHILEATATPIPRTMAQTIFGNKQVSLIKDCPVEKSIKTRLIGNSGDEKREAMSILNHWVKKGRRIAVIYPLVSEHKAHYYQVDADSLKDAEKIAALMRKSGVTIQKVTTAEEAAEILSELDESVNMPFIIHAQGEDTSHTRLQKRFTHYMGNFAPAIQYLGSRIDDDMEKRNRTTIINGADRWEKIYPGRVVSIHGRSKSKEKSEIINYMNNGHADVLLSTTLIEIGVDVKNLNALMVIDAEKLGAYTLHQLRGRIARNGGSGDFIMMTGSPIDELEKTSKERLDLLVNHTSGDAIAMFDMEQRGFGNLSDGGKEQKGFEEGLFPSLKISPAELDAFLRKMAKNMNREKEAGLTR